MTVNPHIRAQEYLAKALVEGLDAMDHSWLDAHLQDCAECSREAGRMRELLRAFRNVPVTVPHGLAARTQMRVRLRAQESALASTSSALLWLVTAASWLLGLFSAPLIWHGFAWIGAQLNLPRFVLGLGFMLWWTVPALVAVGVVLQQKAVGGFAAGKKH